jgi:hypothetical protein
MSDELTDCPSCGGAGGGPFGRAGSAWDTEDYVCPRCRGVGKIRLAADAPVVARPGVVKTAPQVQAAPKKRRASGDES